MTHPQQTAHPERPALQEGNAPLSHKSALKEAALLAKDMMTLLADENEALTNRNIDLVGERIKEKNRLSIKLENALKAAKAQKDAATQADTETQALTQQLKEDMDSFKTLVRKNAILLKSAHQVRADTLNMIRTLIHNKRNTNNVYNQSGSVSSPQNRTTLMVKDV